MSCCPAAAAKAAREAQEGSCVLSDTKCSDLKKEYFEDPRPENPVIEEYLKGSCDFKLGPIMSTLK